MKTPSFPVLFFAAALLLATFGCDSSTASRPAPPRLLSACVESPAAAPRPAHLFM